MPAPLQLPKTFAQRLRKADRPQYGFWINSGSPVACEIAASAGYDWLLIDAEHTAYSLETILELVRITDAYPATPVVRLPKNDVSLIKRYLDLGAQNLMVPMIDSAEEAEQAVASMHYPPRGVRGVGSILVRAGRFGGIPNYSEIASESVSLTLQIESAAGLENLEEICKVDGIDAIFVGPADLAASMGYMDQPRHPEVAAAVKHIFDVARANDIIVGANSFAKDQAEDYIAAGAAFVAMGADVQLLANSIRGLAAEIYGENPITTPQSY